MRKLVRLLFFLLLIAFITSCAEKSEDQKNIADLQQKIEQLTIKVGELEKENAALKEEIKKLTQPIAEKETAPIKLTFSIFFPPTHGQTIAAMDWAKEIERLTDNKVQITVFPGGTLTKAPQCYSGVVNGISDLGFSLFAYTRGRFPVMAAVDLPMGYPDGKVASKVAQEFAKTFKPEELNDVKVLYLHAHGPGLLHTKKPVRKLEDLKGMKIRATGLSAKVVQALGGVPVAMPQGSTYESLKKGVVEGTFGPMEVLKGWKQAEVIKYTTECYSVGYTTTFFVVMNLDKWKALPADIQKVFETVSEKYVGVHGKVWDNTDEEGRKYTLSLGNEIIPLSDEESARWRKAVEPVINDYITNTPNGDAYVKKIKALMCQQ
ncbi:MAG: C4-dicarboxylate ABC transporter substrate-binding protein [Deltaproteobacteria bacterium]|nr:MAG: C4-dicarboxylate ABC transporter substrate-binding protein [Deltaproteobacteria bacterium]